MTTVQVLDIEISETERHALHRLLGKARAEGVQLKRDHLGRFWATSTSQPGTMYAVTAYSCTCKGYQGHQRCKHLAALLSALGWLTTPDPEPTPVAVPTPVAPTCTGCSGRGFHIKAVRVGRDWARQDVPCPQCSTSAAA